MFLVVGIRHYVQNAGRKKDILNARKEVKQMTCWIGNVGFQGFTDPFPDDVTPIEVLRFIDGPGNDVLKVYVKAKEILQALQRRKKVVVFCHAGLSRSPGFVITVLAYLNQLSWDETYVEMKSEHKQIQIEKGFEQTCKEVLDMMNERLTKECPNCHVSIEGWESICQRCYDDCKLKGGIE